MFNTQQKSNFASFANFQKMLDKYQGKQVIEAPVSLDEEIYEPTSDIKKCSQCGSSDVSYISNSHQTACNQCGIVDTAQVLFNANIYSSYTIKSYEERNNELKLVYLQLTNDCSQILITLGVQQPVIDDITKTALSQLKDLEKKNQTILTKFFACILYETVKDINCNKKFIYEYFKLDINKHCQYIKKINQLKEQFKTQPDVLPVQIIGNSINCQNLYICLYFYAKSKLGYQTANMQVFSLIAQFMDLTDCQIKNTTNSVVIEFVALQGIHFKYSMWKQLIDDRKLPKELKQIESSLYSVDLTQTPVNFIKKREDSKNTMNTAINLYVKSYTSKKVYNLKVFSKGKIVVAGLLNPYEQSELNIIIKKLITCILTANNRIYTQPDTVKTIMSNFSSHIDIGTQFIDIAQAYQYMQVNMNLIQKLCADHNTSCSQIQVINHRIYINLNIYKQVIHFANENKESTSNSRSSRSVQFILTQRGIYNIQGADDNLINTIHVRMVFNLIVNNFIKKFVYSDHITYQQDAFVDENEIKNIIDYCKSDSLEIDQLIRNVWLDFQYKHILAKNSIKIKKQYFHILTQIIKLSINNDKDVHVNTHDYTSVKYMIEKQNIKCPNQKNSITTNQPKIPICVIQGQQSGSLTICYKCMLKIRKQTKITQKTLFTFLEFVIQVPEINTQFIQLITSILFVISTIKRVRITSSKAE